MARALVTALIVLILASVSALSLFANDSPAPQLGHAPPTHAVGFEPYDNVPSHPPGTKRVRAAAASSSKAWVYPTDELLDALAYCETGGTMDPATNTGNGFYGAFQFMVETWWSVGGEGYPHEHPYEVQRELARILIQQAGWAQFPVCSRVIGAR